MPQLAQLAEPTLPSTMPRVRKWELCQLRQVWLLSQSCQVCQLRTRRMLRLMGVVRRLRQK